MSSSAKPLQAPENRSLAIFSLYTRPCCWNRSVRVCSFMELGRPRTLKVNIDSILRIKKSAGRVPGARDQAWNRGGASGRAHVLGLRALLALGDAEAHLLAFHQGLVPRTADDAEVHARVRPVAAPDGAETLGALD